MNFNNIRPILFFYNLAPQKKPTNHIYEKSSTGSSVFVSGTNCYQCSKTDEYPFICEGFRENAPQGDNATIQMPTAFTPNGDGLNDMLGPTLHGIASLTFTVYNIDQKVVFTTQEINKGFAASRPVNKDVYYYRVEATSLAGNRVARCGTVYALNCIPLGSRAKDFVFSDQLDPSMPEEYIKPESLEQLQECK